MPVGIDTNFFKPDSSVQKKPNSILFLGRIDPVKNVDIFVEALRELKDSGVEFSATIAGSSSDKYKDYEKIIRDKMVEYSLSDEVWFTGAINQEDALKLYREHELYVNLTPSGSMDKTIFEAMASNVTPLVYNTGLKESLGQELILTKLNTDYIADKLNQVLRNKKDKNFRDLIVEEHSLKKLIDNLLKEILV
jgi:glycosyltransferase involved in cell wall biosynthesis